MTQPVPSLVIFGASNILSDLFDAAWSTDLLVSRIVIDQPEPPVAGTDRWRIASTP